MTRLALLALVTGAILRAQYPPELHWRQIRTPHFQIVYPSEIESDAQHLAAALETLYAPLSRSLGTTLPRHTTVLLPNQGVTRYSSGYVALFPRMAVMQAMPSQQFWGTNDWIDTLTVEEGRHLVQVAKMNHAFGKMMYVLFGEAGLASNIGWSAPDWWLAGDSRAAQSALLRGGIGDYASSEMATRAFLMSGENYSFMKAMHGSLRDQVPSQAELGAFLVNHVDRTSGSEAWDKIMSRTANSSWNPFALSWSMKKETGRDAEQTFRETMSQLGETWRASTAGIVFSRPEILNNAAARQSFTNYFQPVLQPDGSVVAQKIGLDTYPVELVRLTPDGREHTIARFAPTVNGSSRTAVVNGKLVWDEYVPDIRWLRGYSEILLRDLGTGRTRRLTHKTRFLNPVLSPDAARIAVVEFLPTRQSSLVILSSETGAELQRFASPHNDMLYAPTWSEDGARIAVVTQGASGRALTVLDLASGAFHDVIPHRDEEIERPVFFRRYILYKSSRIGTVNIFAVDTESGQCYQVTTSQFGADYPSVSPDGTRLLYSDYTVKGYNAAELPLDPASWTRVDFVAPSSTSYQQKSHDYSAEVPAGQFPAQPYHATRHLFDVHSWGFTSGPPEVGFGVFSNDKMGLLDSQASFLYNTDEGKPGVETSFHYNRFFPVLDFSIADRERKLQYIGYSNQFSERTASGGFHVPLNLSRGYYNSGISAGMSLEGIQLNGGSLVPLNYGLGVWHLRRQSPRDLAPLWGQILRFGYSQTLRADSYTANRLFVDGRFALPGLIRHQALVLESGYERDTGNYTFSRQIAFPRGYTAITGPNLTKLAATYDMPLFYPDWSLGSLLYIRRISTNTFYDYGKVGPQLYRSTGVELVFDLNIAHWPSFRIGLREAYRIDYANQRLNPFIAFAW